MQERMNALQEHHEKEDRTAFFEQLIDIAPGLESYVRNRLRTAEHNGLIPAGLYAPDDILDEVYLYAYEHFEEMPADESGLRVMLFQLANDRLDAIIREEAWQRLTNREQRQAFLVGLQSNRASWNRLPGSQK
jgi:hypothetical protein